MLTRILLGYMLRTAAVMVGTAIAVAYVLGGVEVARAVAIGGVVVGGSGAIQIWLVGYLLDPEAGTPEKIASGFFLAFKLLLVCVIFWLVLSRTQPHQVGLLAGMVVGLASLVLGAHRGSNSPEGIAAMNEAERKITEKLEDSDSEKR